MALPLALLPPALDFCSRTAARSLLTPPSNVSLGLDAHNWDYAPKRKAHSSSSEETSSGEARDKEEHLTLRQCHACGANDG